MTYSQLALSTCNSQRVGNLYLREAITYGVCYVNRLVNTHGLNMNGQGQGKNTFLSLFEWSYFMATRGSGDRHINI